MTYGWNLATIKFLEDEYPIDDRNEVQFQLNEKDLGDMPKRQTQIGLLEFGLTVILPV